MNTEETATVTVEYDDTLKAEYALSGVTCQRPSQLPTFTAPTWVEAKYLQSATALAFNRMLEQGEDKKVNTFTGEPFNYVYYLDTLLGVIDTKLRHYTEPGKFYAYGYKPGFGLSPLKLLTEATPEVPNTEPIPQLLKKHRRALLERCKGCDNGNPLFNLYVPTFGVGEEATYYNVVDLKVYREVSAREVAKIVYRVAHLQCLQHVAYFVKMLAGMSPGCVSWVGDKLVYRSDFGNGYTSKTMNELSAYYVGDTLSVNKLRTTEGRVSLAVAAAMITEERCIKTLKAVICQVQSVSQ